MSIKYHPYYFRANLIIPVICIIQAYAPLQSCEEDGTEQFNKIFDEAKNSFWTAKYSEFW